MNNGLKLTCLSLCLIFFSCQQAKEADIDLDGQPDVLVKSSKIKDFNKQDNIFVFDDIVVNAVTNQQWTAKNDQLELVKKPTFKMKFDTKGQTWEKIPLQKN